ncbi:hypothetical protein Tco_1541478 [Tanacetum coccineum]
MVTDVWNNDRISTTPNQDCKTLPFVSFTRIALRLGWELHVGHDLRWGEGRFGGGRSGWWGGPGLSFGVGIGGWAVGRVGRENMRWYGQGKEAPVSGRGTRERQDGAFGYWGGLGVGGTAVSIARTGGRARKLWEDAPFESAAGGNFVRTQGPLCFKSLHREDASPKVSSRPTAKSIVAKSESRSVLPPTGSISRVLELTESYGLELYFSTSRVSSVPVSSLP